MEGVMDVNDLAAAIDCQMVSDAHTLGWLMG